MLKDEIKKKSIKKYEKQLESTLINLSKKRPVSWY